MPRRQPKAGVRSKAGVVRSRLAKRRASKNKWSAQVTKKSDALDLEHGVFSQQRPKDIAHSLKRSAQHSKRRKSEPYHSAMSMLTFYINRAGNSLSRERLNVLERAKVELRRMFGRDAR